MGARERRIANYPMRRQGSALHMPRGGLFETPCATRASGYRLGLDGSGVSVLCATEGGPRCGREVGCDGPKRTTPSPFPAGAPWTTRRRSMLICGVTVHRLARPASSVDGTGSPMVYAKIGMICQHGQHSRSSGCFSRVVASRTSKPSISVSHWQMFALFILDKVLQETRKIRPNQPRNTLEQLPQAHRPWEWSSRCPLGSNSLGSVDTWMTESPQTCLIVT